MAGAFRAFVGTVGLLIGALDLGNCWGGPFCLVPGGGSAAGFGDPLLLTWIPFGVGFACLVSAILAFLGFPPLLTWGSLAVGLGAQWAVWDILGVLGVLGRSFDGAANQARLWYVVITCLAVGVFFVVLGSLGEGRERLGRVQGRFATGSVGGHSYEHHSTTEEFYNASEATANPESDSTTSAGPTVIEEGYR